MTQVEVSFDEETLRKVLLGDKGAEVLLEKVMNEILQAEMTEHLGAEPGEQTDDRQGYRNGSYQRTLTTRIGSLKLEMPRDREGSFFGEAVRAISAVGESPGLGAVCRWSFRG